MQLKSHTIADGVTLHTLDTDRFKTNYLSVNFLLPLRRETASLASLLPKVLKRGTLHYPDITSLSRRYDMLYSSDIYPHVTQIGEQQIFGFRTEILKDRYVPDGSDLLHEVLQVLGELLFAPVTENGVFRNDYVQAERRILLDEIDARINHKSAYALFRCKEIMCEGEHYAISCIGSQKEVAAITPESLYAFYRHILETARIEIFFVGQTDTHMLLTEMQSLFSMQQRHFTRLPGTEVIRSAAAVRSVTEYGHVSQGKLVLGFRTGSIITDGNYEALSMFLTVYGTAPTSKLFLNVREKLGLCYYCRANMDSHKGVMVVSSGIAAKNKEAAQQEILSQLDEIRAGHISEDELESARKALINSYGEMHDSPAELEGYYFNRLLAGIQQTPADSIRRIASVTLDDIAAAAQKITLDTAYFLAPEQTEGGEADESIPEDEACDD